MNVYARTAAIEGKRPRVGALVDMAGVDEHLYSVDPSLPPTMWTCAPKAKPNPAPLTAAELQAAEDDRMDRRDAIRGRNVLFALAALGDIGR